jgi:tetratricopeptide (TPR) repeat protein
MKSMLVEYLRQHDRAWVFSLLTIAFAVYLPFIGNPFVFDDLPFLASTASRYASSEFGFLDLRWISYVTLGWTWAFFGEAPSAYRVGNVFLHALNGILLFYFSRQLVTLCVLPDDEGQRRVTRGAWIGALIFICHPVAVYAAGYVVQRSILMATLFMLVMLLACLHGFVSGRKRWLVLAVGAYFLMIFSKEHSVAGPAVALMLGVLISSRMKASRPALWMAGAAFAAVGLLVVLRTTQLVGVAYETSFEVAGADSYFMQQGVSNVPPALLHLMSALTQAGLFFKYLLLWWWPNPAWMSIDMRMPVVSSLSDWQAWTAGAAFVTYGALAAWLLFKRGKLGLIGFALLFPWLMFLVEFTSVRVQEPFALYRSYLWLPGMIVLVPLALVVFRSRAAAAVMLVVAIGFVPLSWNRLWSFSDSFKLWDDAAALLPDEKVVGSDRIYYNRGHASLAQKNWDMAIADFSRVVSNNPKLQAAYLNLGSAYFGAGRYREAVIEYDNAIRLNPKDAQAYFSKGLALKRQHNEVAALEQIKISCNLGNLMACAVMASVSQPENAAIDR